MEWRLHTQGRLSGEVILITPEGEQFRCALCRGKGVLPSKKAECPACRGEGVVKVRPPVAPCAYCKGHGEVPIRSNITCPVCSGKGVVSVHEPLKVCRRCRGTGAEPTSKLPCLVCRGKGVVTAGEDGGGGAISLRCLSLSTQGYEVDEGLGAGYTWQPQRTSRTRMANPGVVRGLVRHLIATERARILGKKAIDLGRYTLEKRARHWRESRKTFSSRSHS